VHSLEELEEEHAATPGLVEEAAPASSRFWGVITVIVALALIASAVAVSYEIYLIGDSGASAVWKGVGG
jgi:hypothetical protein